MKALFQYFQLPLSVETLTLCGSVSTEELSYRFPYSITRNIRGAKEAFATDTTAVGFNVSPPISL